MLTALARDFGKTGIEVIAPLDSRMPPLKIRRLQTVPVRSADELPKLLFRHAGMCSWLLLNCAGDRRLPDPVLPVAGTFP